MPKRVLDDHGSIEALNNYCEVKVMNIHKRRNLDAI